MIPTDIVQKSVTGGLYNGFVINPSTGYVTKPVGYSSDFEKYKKGDEIEKGFNLNDDIYSITSKISRTISNQIVWKVRKINTINGDFAPAHHTFHQKMVNRLPLRTAK